jgi:hypothetical protein
MRVHFERSGGFGGIRLIAELDTDQLQATYGATRVQIALSPEEARHLEKLVECSDSLLCQQGRPLQRGVLRDFSMS